MLRFSLLTLAGAVTAVAVACAALIYASPLIASVMWTLVVAALAVATVAAVLGTSGSRGFWAGFAIVAGMFTFVTLSPALGRLPDLLVTTHLWERAAMAMPQAYSTDVTVAPGTVSPPAYYQPIRPYAAAPAPNPPLPAAGPIVAYPTTTTSYAIATVYNPSPVAVRNGEFTQAFMHIGQAISVLILGLIGGLLGSVLVSRKPGLAAQPEGA